MDLIVPAVGLALGLAWIIFRTRFAPATEEEKERWAAVREARAEASAKAAEARAQGEKNNVHI